MSRHHLKRRAWLVAALLLGGIFLGRPAIAWAHAHLTKSEPAAKAMLSTPPRNIRLWFSEKPELALTTVTLADSLGKAVQLGAVERDGDGALAVKVPIPVSLDAGPYTVSWRTAASDGHPSSGKFTFRVAASTETVVPVVVAPPKAVDSTPTPPAPAAGAPTDEPAEGVLTPAFVFARAISFAALLAVIGAVAFRYAVLPRASALDAASLRAMSKSIARVASMAALLYIVSALARLYLENRMMSGSAAMDAAHLRTMTMSTQWGAALRAQIGAAFAAFVGFMIARRGPSVGWLIAGVAGLGLAVATALGGHAASIAGYETFNIVDDTLHIIGAGGWLGSLFWLGTVGLSTTHAPVDSRVQRIASLVNAFSPAALGFSGLVALTGVVSATFRLGSVAALWSTSYGQVLVAKLALLGVLAAVGYHNWQRVRPSLGTADSTVRLGRSTKLELGVGVLIVIVTAILVATPTPMSGH